MCTQPNVIEALREAEAALELAIRRILKRDPGHHVEVTSEAKALVSVRQALQCQGCDVPKDGVYQISEPSHSMSMYASKDDMLKAALAENERLKQGQANLCQFFAEVYNALEAVAQGWQDRAIGTTTQRAVEAIKQLAAAQQGVRKGVLVDAGALQMVVNALRRDAEEGKHARGEMADELLAYATHPTTQGLDAQAIERAAQKLAEIAEYNWAQLTEKQREEFRTDALSALTAALGLGHE